ncbi:MAG: acetate--CoA ligase family protein [Thermodesulfobacteriota bacterium]
MDHPDQTTPLKRNVLTEYHAKQFLKQYAIPATPEIIAADADEAVSAARSFGFPVVLKGMGSSLLHKTERGLVHLHLGTAEAVRDAAGKIIREAGKELEGLLVQPMMTGAREFVAGLFRDRVFGPVVMFGLGGIFTEALSDVSFRLAPLTGTDAREMMNEIRSASLLGPFRGEPAVDVNALASILMGLSEIGMACPHIAEIDINPLIITRDGKPVAVDALVVEEISGAGKDFLQPVEPGIVGSLFYPKSIAFVGASGAIGKWGYTLLTNTIGGGYAGKIYMVNQKGGTIAGHPVYPSILDIPGKVDVAVVTIPAEAVADLIPQCKTKGIKRMLLIASGFSETGMEGKSKEIELVNKAREAGVYIIGPNTMGICNPHIHFYCTGSHVRPLPGSIGVVAQSGNMGNQLLAFAEQQGIGIRGFCGSGNEAMITIEDYLDAFEVDPLTETVMLYIESVKNGRRFFESARRLGKKKPIVLLKGGQTKAGNKAASSHTGAMTSDTRVFNAVCRQAGIVRVDKPMDLLDLSAAFSSLPLPVGNRVAIMTLGGGWGVVSADLCEAYGMEVVPLSKDIIEKIDRILPPFWSRANPIDLVGDNDMSIPLSILEELANWDGCDAIINLGIMGRRHMVSQLADSIRKADTSYTDEFLNKINERLIQFEERYVRQIIALMEKHHKPIIGVAMLKDEKDRTVYTIEGGTYKGVFFSAPEQAVQSLAKMYEYQKFIGRETE